MFSEIPINSTNNSHCWVCGQAVIRFQNYGLPPRWGCCPHCAAKPRTRTLWWYLRYQVRPALHPNSEILEVGPSRIHVQQMATPAVLGSGRYTAIDQRQLKFHAGLKAPHRFIRMNAAGLGFADGVFDMVLCCNVLPYVTHYLDAINELYRCLANDGIAVITTAYRDGETQPVAEWRQQRPDLTDAWYAENGDAWVFGSDFPNQLCDIGFKIRRFDPFRDQDATFRQRNGLKPHNELLLAARNDYALHRFTTKMSSV